MSVKEKLQELRKVMLQQQLEAVVVYANDPHMSEYLPQEWAHREWLSGFTGSAGTLVVASDQAALWTDSRYYVQAAKELEGSTIELMKADAATTPSIPAWLQTNLNANTSVATNGLCASHADFKSLEKELEKYQISLVDADLVTTIWKDRPLPSCEKVQVHPLQYAGKTVGEKLTELRAAMQSEQADLHFIGALDCIAWLFNIRGADVAYNPVVLSYALISHQKATLFIEKQKLDKNVTEHLQQFGVEVKPYGEVFETLSSLKNKQLWIPLSSSHRAFRQLDESNKVKTEASPILLMKGIKNPTEIDGMKNAMRKDGIALTHFFYWLQENLGKENITEVSAANKLIEFRNQQQNFVGASFGSIVGYNGNGAIVHYRAEKESCSNLEAKGYLLIDSGGQYWDGTTDITRTLPLSETISDEYKTDYTLALKGMIKLSMIQFPEGTKGCQLDILARQALWEVGKDYGHGTGHGVGCFMNVHEGPQSIRKDLNPQAFEAGMITSNEPGFYKEGAYGIRHENLLLCIEKEQTPYGNFLGFETLTLFPFFTAALDLSLLSEEEKNWINEYHQKVWGILAPHLEGECLTYLEKLTQPI